MYKNFIKPVGLIFAVIAGCLFTACEKEDSAAGVENYVLQSTFEIEERSGSGMAGCYELVFPVTLQFADGTTQEVGSYEELKQAIREWYQGMNVRPRPALRPHLAFPYDVINEDGEIITVSTLEELVALRRACIASVYGSNHHGHLGKDRHCFKPVFPFTLEFPDGSQVAVNTPLELRQAIRTWKQANPDSTERPEFVFPITVQLRDGTQVVVNTPEELRALKADCRG